MTKLPFVLSLSKDRLGAHRSCFDKLSTNGVSAIYPPQLWGGGPRSGGGGSPQPLALRLAEHPLRHALRARHLPVNGEDLMSARLQTVLCDISACAQASARATSPQAGRI